MKNVSQFFKDAVKDLSVARSIAAKAQLLVVEQVGEHTITSSPTIGFINQLFNDNSNGIEWITTEPARFKLDGSMGIPNYSEDYEYGFVSQAVSDAAGAINISLEITMTKEYVTNGLTLRFQELVKDFSITLDDTTTYQITNNQDLNYWYSQELTFTKITINFTKVEPNRRLRLLEVYFGRVVEFDNNNIISLDIIDEISLTNETLALDSCDLKIVNENKAFDLLNPNGIQKYLKQNQVLKAYLGVKIGNDYEYTQMGEYYLRKWNTEKQTVTFEAYDILDVFEDSEYRFGKIQSRTLYDMLEELLQGQKYEIADELDSITVSGYIPLVSKAEAMRMMLQAGSCLLTIDETGKLIIAKHQRILERNTYLNYSGQKRSGEFYTELDCQRRNTYIDADNMKAWPKIEQQKPYAAVSVDVNSFVVDTESKLLYNGTVRISNGEPIIGGYRVWVPYTEGPATNVTVTGAVSYQAYAHGAYVVITADSAINIQGYGVTVNVAPYLKTKYAFNNLYVINNPLVLNDSLADEMATFLLKDYTLKGSADYRGFIYLDASDGVTMETEYGDTPLYITKQTFEFEGYLKGSVEGVNAND